MRSLLALSLCTFALGQTETDVAVSVTGEVNVMEEEEEEDTVDYNDPHLLHTQMFDHYLDHRNKTLEPHFPHHEPLEVHDDGSPKGLPNGGWNRTQLLDNHGHSPEEKIEVYVCNIHTRDAHNFTVDDFNKDYWGKKPLILRGGTAHWPAQIKWSKQHLLSLWADVPFLVGNDLEGPADINDDHYEHGDRYHYIDLAEYLQLIERGQCHHAIKYGEDNDHIFTNCSKDSHLYLVNEVCPHTKCGELPEHQHDPDSEFPDHALHPHSKLPNLPDIVKDAPEPPYFGHWHDDGRGSRLFLSIGGHGSGVTFKQDSETWNGVIWGMKRWFFYPPGGMPAMPPHSHTAEMSVTGKINNVLWWKEVYPTASPHPLECVAQKGDLVYIPDRWYRNEINIGETVAVSGQPGVTPSVFLPGLVKEMRRR